MKIFSICFPWLIALLAGCAPSDPLDTHDRSTPHPEAVTPPTAAQSTSPHGDHPPPLPTKHGSQVTRSLVTDEVSTPPTQKTHLTPTLDEMLLFFPSKYPSGDWQPQNLAFEDVWFTTDDRVRIHGWYCPCDKPRAILLYAHGNAGNLSHRAPLLARLQQQLCVSVLIFDYRGYGRSDGIPTVEGIMRDARAARVFLAKHAAIDESQIVLMGRSLGGAVAVQMAAESRPRALILESTFSSLTDVASVHYPRLAWLVPPDKLNSAAQITRYEGPLLQSHGDADRTIPYSLGQKLFRKAHEPKQFVTIPDGDHNTLQTAEYYTQLDRFIDSLTNEPP